VKRLNDAIATLVRNMDATEVVAPDDLRQRVEAALDRDRSRVWDLVVADLADEDAA
jgi:hypothetical protein